MNVILHWYNIYITHTRFPKKNSFSIFHNKSVIPHKIYREIFTDGCIRADRISVQRLRNSLLEYGLSMEHRICRRDEIIIKVGWEGPGREFLPLQRDCRSNFPWNRCLDNFKEEDRVSRARRHEITCAKFPPVCLKGHLVFL